MFVVGQFYQCFVIGDGYWMKWMLFFMSEDFVYFCYSVFQWDFVFEQGGYVFVELQVFFVVELFVVEGEL